MRVRRRPPWAGRAAAAAHDAILDALNLHAPTKGKLGDGKAPSENAGATAAAPAPAPAAAPVLDDDDDDEEEQEVVERTEL